MLDDLDREVMEGLEGLGVYLDAVYTPVGGGDAVSGVYVAVDDLISEADGEVTQGGALLSLLRSQVGVPAQGGTVKVDGVTWKIGRRQPSTDPSVAQVEAYKS